MLGFFTLSVESCLLLHNKRVIEKIKPQVHCKMTIDRRPIAAREIPVGYVRCRVRN